MWKYDKKYRGREKLLRRKIMKLIKVLYYGYKPHNHLDGAKIDEAVEKLRKVTYPRILNN